MTVIEWDFMNFVEKGRKMKAVILIWDYTINSDLVTEAAQPEFFKAMPIRGNANQWMKNEDGYRMSGEAEWCYGEIIWNMIYRDSQMLKDLGIPFPESHQLPAIYCMNTTSEGYSCVSKFCVTQSEVQSFIRANVANQVDL